MLSSECPLQTVRRAEPGVDAGITQGSFKVETPQTLAHQRPSILRRQRTLAIIIATLGMFLGGLMGAAFAAPESPAPEQVTAAGPASTAGADGADSLVSSAASGAGAYQHLWTETPAEEDGELALTPLIFKVCFGLGLVVMLAWGTMYLLRRTTVGQTMGGGGSAVRVVDRNWLGPKKAIYLVDIAGRTLALGVTEEHISVLSTWEEGEIELTRPEPPQSSFTNQFKTLLQRRRGELSTAGGLAQ